MTDSKMTAAPEDTATAATTPSTAVASPPDVAAAANASLAAEESPEVVAARAQEAAAAAMARQDRYHREAMADVAEQMSEMFRGRRAPAASAPEPVPAAPPSAAAESPASAVLPETASGAEPSVVAEWKALVAAISPECAATTYFLSREEERSLSEQTGWGDWNDRMSGYAMVDGAEARGREGRDRALALLSESAPARGEARADTARRVASALLELPEAADHYSRKGVWLVVTALRRADAK